MDAVLSLDVSEPEAVKNAVTPSLRDSGPVQYRIDTDDELRIAIETEGLGPLRGATNTALMLVKLSDKVLNYED